MSANGDTSYSYKYQTKQVRKLSLPFLQSLLNKEYYRVWTNKQVIDIWQNQSGIISGTLTTWTDEYIPNNEKPTNRTFIKVNSLSQDTANLVRQLFISSDILNLPTGDSIKGWQNGFDGITYIIENSSKNNYYFKTYWTPEAQDSLIEAKRVQLFVDSAFTLANASNVWRQFTTTIPYECYINGGPGVACKVLTKKERKKYIRERKNSR